MGIAWGCMSYLAWEAGTGLFGWDMWPLGPVEHQKMTLQNNLYFARVFSSLCEHHFRH